MAKDKKSGWFGHIAVEKGFITLEQLVNGLNIQAMENYERNLSRPLGVILHENKLMSLSQISEVLGSQIQMISRPAGA